MKKNDIILIAAMFIIAGVIAVLVRVYGIANTGDNAYARVTVSGEEYGTYLLNGEAVIRIDGEEGSYNVVEISGGRAKVSEADCPDQICVKHRAISRAGEEIVCLPNKLVVEIIGGDEEEIDGSTY